MLAAAAALLAWRLAVERRQPPPPPPSAVQLQFPAPDGAVFGAGNEPLDAALSAGAEEVVFVATANGSSQLWRRVLGSGRAEPIPGTVGARHPAWIPGRREVSFFSGDVLKRTDLEGRFTDVATIAEAAGAAWSDDGSVLVGRTRGAIERWRAGQASPATRLQPGDVGHRFPSRVDAIAWLYLAERADGRRVVRLVRDGSERTLTDADGHAMAANGWLIYPRGGALLAQRLREDGAVAGRAHPLVVGVGVSPGGRTFAALSPRVAVFAPPTNQQHHLQWFDAGGGTGAIASEPGDYWQVRLSPDDRQAAVTMLEPLLRTLDVYVLRGGLGRAGAGDAGARRGHRPGVVPRRAPAALPLGPQRPGPALHAGGRHRGRGGRPAAGAAGRRGVREHPAVGLVAQRRDPVLRNRRIAAEHGCISGAGEPA